MNLEMLYLDFGSSNDKHPYLAENSRTSDVSANPNNDIPGANHYNMSRQSHSPYHDLMGHYTGPGYLLTQVRPTLK